jgi:hypothetical protein
MNAGSVLAKFPEEAWDSKHVLPRGEARNSIKPELAP